MFALDNWPKAKEAWRSQIGDLVVCAYTALDRKAHLYEGLAVAIFGHGRMPDRRKSAPWIASRQCHEAYGRSNGRGHENDL